MEFMETYAKTIRDNLPQNVRDTADVAADRDMLGIICVSSDGTSTDGKTVGIDLMTGIDFPSGDVPGKWSEVVQAEGEEQLGQFSKSIAKHPSQTTRCGSLYLAEASCPHNPHQDPNQPIACEQIRLLARIQ